MPISARPGAIRHAFSTPGFLQPFRQRLFAVRLLKRAHQHAAVAAHGLLLKRSHAVQIAPAFGFVGKAQADLLHSGKVFSKLRSCPQRRRARVVELVHKAGGKRAERSQLFTMDRVDLIGLQPPSHVAENGGTHPWAGEHELPEGFLIEADKARCRRGNHRVGRLHSFEQWHLAE